MKMFLFLLGEICSYICPRIIMDKYKAVKIFFYTGFKSRYFQSLGKNSTLGINTIYVGEQYIVIGNNTSIGDYGRLTAYDRNVHSNQSFSPQIKIGDNCCIGAQSHITAINKIVIGNNLLTGPRVLISDNSHGESVLCMLDIAPKSRPLYSKGSIVIEDNVWIGEGAMILSNVHIGKGAIIACNSVVVSDVPAYSVVAGSPAKIVKMLK